MREPDASVDRSSIAHAVTTEARRSMRALVPLAALVEAFVAAFALSQRLPIWLAAGLISAVPPLAYAISCRRQRDALQERLNQVYQFDRKYELTLSELRLGPSSVEGYFAGTFSSQREIVALRPMRAWNWNITRRSDADSPFAAGGASPEILRCTASRSGSGDCIVPTGFHKQTTTLAFGIRFEPPLRPLERVDLAFTAFVPAYMPATLKGHRSRPPARSPSPGESDFTSTDISFLIDRVTKVLVIPKSLGTTNHGLQVLLRDDVFHEEEAFIRNQALFSIDTVTEDGEECWRLRLDRENPPLRASYRLHWTPPDN